MLNIKTEFKRCNMSKEKKIGKLKFRHTTVGHL